MRNKKLIILLLLVIAVAFSGCVKKDKQPVENYVNNQVENSEDNKVATTSEDNDLEPVVEEIKYLENGEVDISDWRTYENDFLGITMKYPPFLVAFDEDTKGDDKKNSFGFELADYTKDRNWNLQFNQTYPDYQLLPLEDKIEKLGSLENRNESLETIEIDKGYIIYEANGTLEGYSPGALVFGEKVLFVGDIQIFDEDDTQFEDYDPKYIKVFKAMIKSIEFVKSDYIEFTSKNERLKFLYSKKWICREIVTDYRVDCYPLSRQSEEVDGGLDQPGVYFADITMLIGDCKLDNIPKDQPREVIKEDVGVFYDFYKNFNGCSLVVTAQNPDIDTEEKLYKIMH